MDNIFAISLLIILVQFSMRYTYEITENTLNIRSRILFFVPLLRMNINLGEISELRKISALKLFTFGERDWNYVYYSKVKKSGIEIVLKKGSWKHPKYMFITPDDRDVFMEIVKTKNPDINIS